MVLHASIDGNNPQTMINDGLRIIISIRVHIGKQSLVLLALATVSMASTSQSNDKQSEWGWQSIKTWWNCSNNEECLKAEMNLINEYIAADIFEYESKQVCIDFDAEPLSVKQKKMKRSQTFSFFSNANANDNDNESKSMNEQSKEYIHTLSVRVKQNKLKSFINNTKSESIKIEKSECIAPKISDEELKNDGNEIEGKSLNRFYQRTKNQKGSSNYSELQKYLKSFSLSSNFKKEAFMEPIVLTHGYGAGGGTYIPSIPHIFESLLCNVHFCQSPVIHSVDWLGNAMSSRPNFECSTTNEAEDWFIDSLEAWRKSMNINKMILVSHSLGGYLSCLYAIKYPQNVKHLVLVSPVGLPKRPKASSETSSKYSWRVKTMFKTFEMFWNGGWTPHDLIRFSGPKGKALIQRLIERRLFRLEDDDLLKQLLADYMYHVIAQRGSAEYCLKQILQPGAWAYHPLVERIGALKQYQKEMNMKIDFVYGETDWMTSAHAVKLKEDGLIDCDVYIVPDCGHQLILENSKGFGQLIGALIAKDSLARSTT